MGQSIFQTIMPQTTSAVHTPMTPVFANPAQKAQYIMNALMNPAAFAKQQFPDIPDNISNNPSAILAYLQQTRGIPMSQINQLNSQNPYGGGQ